jgi:hypothetical protein
MVPDGVNTTGVVKDSIPPIYSSPTFALTSYFTPGYKPDTAIVEVVADEPPATHDP